MRKKWLQWSWKAAGWLSLAMGIIGLVVPLVWPTTPFVLLSCYCFSRGSERWHQYLLQHRYFGTTLRSWQERRAIPRRAKRFATVMMLLPLPWTFYALGQYWYFGLLLLLLLFVAVLWWIWSYPDA